MLLGLLPLWSISCTESCRSLRLEMFSVSSALVGAELILIEVSCIVDLELELFHKEVILFKGIENLQLYSCQSEAINDSFD